MGFNTPEDIANRALQHCGVPPLDRISSLTDSSKNAKECAFCYHKLRKTEMEQNAWRFSIQKAVLRPVATTDMAYTPAAYVAGTTYSVGDIVTYDDPVDSTTRWWQSTQPGNIGNTPTSGAPWANYAGPIIATLYASTVAYSAGELAYKTPGDGTYTVYSSLTNANADDPATTAAYDATVTYKKNDVVVYSAQNYISLVDLNTANTPNTSPSQWATTALSGSNKWRKLGGTLAELNIIYPIGTGPSTQIETRNVFRLPYGYLRTAPQDPKAGSTSYLGAPSGLAYTDWLYEGPYIVSSQSNPIVLRFVSDWSDVTTMTSMFCEGLAARIAFEICESITQSTDKLRVLTGEYEKAINEAKLQNAIEVGSEEPPIDDYLACRA